MIFCSSKTKSFQHFLILKEFANAVMHTDPPPPTPETSPKTFEKGALIPQPLENLKFYFQFCHS